MGYMLTKNNITDFVEFADYKIVELSVPESWIGKSLLELDLRRRYHVNVIAVSRADGSVDVSPSPDKAFTKGDRVSVIGSDSDIDKTVAQLK